MPPKTSTRNIVWGQSAGRCCICKKTLVLTTQKKSRLAVGEIAHIIGENEGSARFSNKLTLEERNQEENLMLLCANHHTEIDNDEIKYTITTLNSIKTKHIDWVNKNLNKKEKWEINISQFTYLNIPRLLEISELSGNQVDVSGYENCESLHSMGWNLNRILLQFERIIPTLNVESISIDQITLSEKVIGNVVSFNSIRFRTKNIVGQPELAHNIEFVGDLSKDPHIYTDVAGIKFVFMINSKWITTTTAFVQFRSGQVVFSGIGRIVNIDFDSNIIYCTPLTIGIPKSPMDDFW